MTVLAVTGLSREARIARRAKVTPVISAANGELLEQRLTEAIAKGATGIVSFGIAGALVPLLKIGDVVVATHVVHGDERYPTDLQWTARIREKLPHAVPGVIAGHDQAVSHVDGKRRLLSLTGAYAVDMESHIAARFANRAGIPFVAIRTISDAANRGLPPAALEPLKPSGSIRLRSVLASLAREPSQLPDLLRTGREAGRAFRALLRSRNALGLFLGCPYLG